MCNYVIVLLSTIKRFNGMMWNSQLISQKYYMNDDFYFTLQESEQ